MNNITIYSYKPILPITVEIRIPINIWRIILYLYTLMHYTKTTSYNYIFVSIK